MIFKHKIRLTAGAALLALGLLAGCKSAEQKALDQAEAQATATNTPQQVQYIDKNGNTVTTTVQPPAAPGQAPQVSTQIQSPPPGMARPQRTKPTITAIGPNGQPIGPAYPAGQTAVAGQNYSNTPTANGQAYPAANGQAYPAANGQAYPAGPGVAPANTTSTTTTTDERTYATSTPPPYPNGQTYNAPAQPNYSVVVPAGTELAVRINQTINVKHAEAGEHFTGEIASAVVHNGEVIIPRGAPVRGRVDAAHHRGHFKGSSILELRLTGIVLNGHEYAMDTHDNVHTKRGKGRRSAGFIGGLGGAGALIGGLAGGGAGLAIGAASGVGAGTLIAGTTGNHDIVIPAESIQHFRLANELVIH